MSYYCERCGATMGFDDWPGIACCPSADAAARSDCGCGGPDELLCRQCLEEREDERERQLNCKHLRTWGTSRICKDCGASANRRIY